MSEVLSRRGQPLVALSLILASWIGARTLLWEAPATARLQPLPALAVRTEGDVSPAPVAAAGALAPRQAWTPSPPPYVARPASPPPPRALTPPMRMVVGQQQLFTSALSDVPRPDALSRTMLGGLPSRTPETEAGPHWSADGWLLLRPGGTVALGAPPVATYGASQAGALLRYRLDPANAHRPTLYARVTAALNGSRQTEAALGLSARPLARVPIVAAAELRVTDDRFGSRTRPVAMLITELRPFRLPGGLTGEAYAQAGYAGGRDATGFVDGMVRADRPVLRAGQAELRVGAGAWGGAQRGAARLDLGPSATLDVPLSETASARMALDWRFRIDGRAAPASGPAFTLSAGF